MAETGTGRRVIVGTVAFFLLVALGVLLTRPDDAFGPRDDTLQVTLGVDEVLLVGLEGPRREVQVVEARPLVSGDAAVRVQVRRCRAPRTGAIDQTQISARELEVYDDAGAPASGDVRLRLPCDDLLPVPGPLAPFVEDVGDQVVLVIQPLEAGSIDIDGISITHVRWLLHRTERTGPELRITTTG